MLKRKTCLLLGAGASKHLGFPLGAELRTKIVFELLGQKNKPKDELPEDFRRGEEDLNAFYDRLSFGNWTSPDAFLERHTEFMKTGKFLICQQLARCENYWGMTQKGGWYDLLVSAIHVDRPEDLENNELSIVTFNYDRSIDFRLHKYVENQFEVPSADAWHILRKAIPIVHVHGTLGEYPKWDYGDTSSIWERGQDIKIISEVEGNTPEFQQATQLLNEAERVVVLGFGFAEANVNRLKFFRECDEDDREITIAAGPQGGSIAESEYVKWVAQWGLKRGRHFHFNSADDLFNHRFNLFA